MNSITILGVLIAIVVFVFDWIYWAMSFSWPTGFAIGTITGILLAIPIIVGFRILGKQKKS